MWTFIILLHLAPLPFTKKALISAPTNGAQRECLSVTLPPAKAASGVHLTCFRWLGQWVAGHEAGSHTHLGKAPERPWQGRWVPEVAGEIIHIHTRNNKWWKRCSDGPANTAWRLLTLGSQRLGRESQLLGDLGKTLLSLSFLGCENCPDGVWGELNIIRYVKPTVGAPSGP